MSVINAVPLLEAAGGGDYTVGKSVRLRSSASAYFNRTPASAGNRQIWTWSGWVKRGALSSGSYMDLFSALSGANDFTEFRYHYNTNDDTLVFSYVVAGTGYYVSSTNVFRDPSAWYHLVCSIDTTQATAANRVKIYVNGVQVSYATTGYPPQNSNTAVNATNTQNIGNINTYGRYFDGYLAEINFIDGQALTPSSFGSTNAITGVWQPAKYTGTYGTNGFYLNFSDNSNNTAATIGKDYSGNGNNWTPNNISVTAGATYDSMTDVPTLTSATAANYGTWNPLSAQASATYTNGNMTASVPNGGQSAGGFPVTSGKWYAEVVCTANPVKIGIRDVSSVSYANNCIMYDSGGQKYLSGTASSYGASWTTNDVIGIAIDMDSSTVTFYKNNTSQGSISLSGQGITAAVIGCLGGGGSTGTYEANWGQRPFSYTPPTGFVALNTYNLPASTASIPNGAKYMAATTYSGTSASQAISNAINSASFQPDFVWMKKRASGTGNHILQDSVRGVNSQLISNSPNNATAYSSDITSFNSDGFTIAGTDSDTGTSGNTYVGWQWKGGGTAVSNTSGTITSTVSANPTSGFSVVTYTGTSANGTIGHGLIGAPSMIICKSRTSSASWVVYHASIGNTQYLVLNSNGAVGTLSTFWNNTSPTTTAPYVFSVGSASNVNQSGDAQLAYCFVPIAGYSAFGSYTGNNLLDGPFVYLGFRPRFIMIKRTDVASDWFMMDSSRPTFNVIGAGNGGQLAANQTYTEATLSTYAIADFLSNGVKIRSDMTYGYLNASGGTYIYAAFAENPFKNSLAR